MKIGVVGCAGRMGRMVIAAVADQEGLVLAGGTEQPGHPSVGQDLLELAGLPPAGVPVGADAEALFRAADVVIDFSTPAATAQHAALAEATATNLVVGVTGLGAREREALAVAARRVALVQAANMSLGITLLLGLARQVAGALGEDFDVEILEMHHRHKVDAPSGTALALAGSVAGGRGMDPIPDFAHQEPGRAGPRRTGDIGFAVLRGGDVVGEHSVLFCAEGERIEITHKATSRTIFARGAVRAALWTRNRPAGLYTMAHVLGLEPRSAT